MKTLYFVLSIFTLCASLSFATDSDQVGQVSHITGIAPNRIAKMKENFVKCAQATDLIREKKFDEGFAILQAITYQNGFEKIEVEGALFDLAIGYKIAGQYELALKTFQNLSSRGWKKSTLESYFAEVKAIIDFKANGDKKPILDFVDWFKGQNKPFFPPKGFELDRLARVIRLLEMTGEIDSALELVEQYFSEKSLAWHTDQKTRTGLALLKQALLRDKQENKNIYAQELINTTDYFGFV